MIFLRMNCALSRQQMERRQLEVGYRLDRPAVAALSIDISNGGVITLLEPLKKQTYIRAPFVRLIERR